jgi:O-antigen chain-terminating methyltransferase
VAFKRLVRPLVKTPQNDLWERQRVFNLILLEQLQRLRDLEQWVREVQAPRLDHLEAVWRVGLSEVMGHNDALFARLDQKLDFLRRETRDIWARFGAALARAEALPPGALAAAHREAVYFELERRYRGTEEEIARRLEVYLPWLESAGGPVLDLGCGRGEFLELLVRRGVPGFGVDASSEMVAECQKKGLNVQKGDLFSVLAENQEASLGAVVAFHVIEHLPPAEIDRLVRLAWRALRPGGVCILETPNPRSLVVAARNFWLDPTHVRPVHPESLRLSYEAAGFAPIELLELRPFADSERLPEIPIDGLEGSARELADSLNRLRDRLDELLFAPQDYALIGTRPH